jgi:hypothetical protein
MSVCRNFLGCVLQRVLFRDYTSYLKSYIFLLIMGSVLRWKFPQVYLRQNCIVNFQLRSVFSDAALHLHPRRFNGGAFAARVAPKVAAIQMNKHNEQR